MTKVHFVALADTIKSNPDAFSIEARNMLANFCQRQNGRFDRERWLNYIAGTHTANGREL